MKNILVIGDCIIDEYLHCSVDRLSPEAPVPIAKIKNRELSAGGGANVACTLSNFKANVAFLSVFSKNKNDVIFSILNKYKIYNIISIPILNENIIKTRVLSNGHHLLRIDQEHIDQDQIYDDKIYSNLLDKIKDFSPDLIVLSDYNKNIINFFNKFYERNNKMFFKEINCDVIADLKPNNFFKIKNIFKTPIHSILPNEKELLESYAVYNNKYEIVNFWLNIEQLSKNIIITMGKNGLDIIDKNNLYHYDSEAIDVNDVTGCGDTVTSVYSYLVSCGKYDNFYSAFIGNKAAAITASKIGTYKISNSELNNLLSMNDYENFKTGE
jgi:rfaE bifunctional protein kinase chain/domain